MTHHCQSCNNEFSQPFVCITCGAQKLYDNTLRGAEQQRDAALAENDMLREAFNLAHEKGFKAGRASRNDLLFTAKRVFRKFGVDSDWTEWRDLGEALADDDKHGG